MNKEYGALIHCERSKCTGCKACELACFAAHTPTGKTVGTVNAPVKPRLFVEANGPVQCKHCEDAPCLNACDKRAIVRTDHQVVVNTNACEGCVNPACATACLFGAIRLLPYASKCDLCLGTESGPACVNACPNHALRFVNIELERETKNIRAAKYLQFMSR